MILFTIGDSGFDGKGFRGDPLDKPKRTPEQEREAVVSEAAEGLIENVRDNIGEEDDDEFYRLASNLSNIVKGQGSDAVLNLINSCPRNLKGLVDLIDGFENDSENDMVGEVNEATENVEGAIAMIDDEQKALKAKNGDEQTDSEPRLALPTAAIEEEDGPTFPDEGISVGEHLPNDGTPGPLYPELKGGSTPEPTDPESQGGGSPGLSPLRVGSDGPPNSEGGGDGKGVDKDAQP